jgi:hypothetical protein
MGRNNSGVTGAELNGSLPYSTYVQRVDFRGGPARGESPPQKKAAFFVYIL